ncbi:MAG: ABC transporter substrate-binding protein [Candidatus Njordarchaeales archaeon]
MKSKIISALLVLLFLQATIAATTHINLPSAEAQQQIIYDVNGELRIALGYWVESLNPIMTATAYDWDILGWLWDSFTVYHPYNWTDIANDMPLLAAERPVFQVVNDSELGSIGVWTVKIRDNVYYTDGEKLDVEDVKFTYDFLDWLYYNQSLTDMYWTDIPEEVINCTIVDDTTVKIYTWHTGIIYAWAALWPPIWPKHIYGDENSWGVVDDDDYDYFPNWNLTADVIRSYVAKSPQDPILTGYGPFYLKEWEPGKDVTTAGYFILERNPNYYLRAIDENGNELVKWRPITQDYIDLHGPYIKRLVYKVITEPEDEYSAFLNGEIDMIQGSWFGRKVPELLQKGYTVDTGLVRSFGHVGVNCNQTVANGLLKNAKFRRALAFAIDKRRLVDEIYMGWTIPVDLPVVPGFYDWSLEYLGKEPGPSYYDANPEEARRILEEELGLKDVDNDTFYELDPNDPDSDITLELALTEDPILEQIYTIIEESIEAAGIKLEPKFMDFRSLIDYWFSGEFQLTYFGWSMGRIPTILRIWTSDYVYNVLIYRWFNETYDEYVDKMFSAPTLAEAKQWAWKAQEILYWEQPAIITVEPITVGAYNASAWAGIVKAQEIPVITYWTIMHCVKIVGYREVTGPAIPYELIIGSIVVIAVVIIVAAVLLRRRPAA